MLSKIQSLKALYAVAASSFLGFCGPLLFTLTTQTQMNPNGYTIAGISCLMVAIGLYTLGRISTDSLWFGVFNGILFAAVFLTGILHPVLTEQIEWQAAGGLSLLLMPFLSYWMATTDQANDSSAPRVSSA